jgi:hypothetical protein
MLGIYGIGLPGSIAGPYRLSMAMGMNPRADIRTILRSTLPGALDVFIHDCYIALEKRVTLQDS